MSDFCTGCGRYLNGDEQQCPDCGKFTQKGMQQNIPKNRDRIKTGENLILIGLCLMGIAIILLF